MSRADQLAYGPTDWIDDGRVDLNGFEVPDVVSAAFAPDGDVA